MTDQFDDVLGSTAEFRRVLGGVSNMFIHRRLQDDPTFPRPIQFRPGGPRKWPLAEGRAWAEKYRRKAPSAADVGNE